jgi:hypothetical protein
MGQGRNSLLIVGGIVLFLFLWMMSQKNRVTAARPAPVVKPGQPSALAKLLASLGKPSAAPKGGGSGGGSSGGGAGTAGGQRSCNKTPGFCGCASNYAYAGKDAGGNEIYQKCDGSLVYSDGSAASQSDIACNQGACVGTVCNPQDQQTAPCTSQGPPCGCVGGGGCADGGCFCGGCL